MATAVRSALAQTCPAVDVVVVNDGSTDDFDAAIAPFADRIRVITQANQGLAGARNTGIDATDTEFVALLDADDAWHPEKIEKQLALLARHPEHALVYTARRAMDEGGTPIAGHHGWASLRPVQGRALGPLIAGNTIQPSSAVIRRSALGAERFSKETYGCEDWDLWLRLAHTGTFGYLDEPLTDYRIHGSNMSSQKERMSRGFLAAMERALERERDRSPASIVSAIRRHRDGLRCVVGQLAFERNDYAEARRCFVGGWRALNAAGVVRLGLTLLPAPLRQQVRAAAHTIRRPTTPAP